MAEYMTFNHATRVRFSVPPKENYMFTNKQKTAYINALGNICPYCKSKDINALGKLEPNDDGTATQVVECFACDKRWEDIYTLAGIIHEDEL